MVRELVGSVRVRTWVMHCYAMKFLTKIQVQGCVCV